MHLRLSGYLAALTLVTGMVGSGCARWRSAERMPTTSSSDGVIASDVFRKALPVLRGTANGILVAANNGLIGSDCQANSLASIRATIDHRLPMAVVGVCQASDGTCFLDTANTFANRAAADTPPNPFSMGELRSLSTESASERFPLLSEALELARGRLILGLRLVGTRLTDVVRMVEDKGLTDQIIIFAGTPTDATAATRILQRNSAVMFAFNVATPAELARIEATPPWPTWILLGPEALSHTNVSRVHAMGARVIVYQRGLLLVRIGAGLAPYHTMGVTVLMTDWPRQLIREMEDINGWPKTGGNRSGRVAADRR